MDKIFEVSYSDDSGAKDGGFIFQAILNYDIAWSIVDGNLIFNQDNIQGWLKQVDIFPDMRFTEGHATLTYVTLSEVNTLKRKFELANEAIKRLINPEYAKEMEGESTSPDETNEVPKPVDGKINEVLYISKLTASQLNSVNEKYFKGTSYNIRLIANGIVLREVSTSGMDSGQPSVTLKLSTGMVDTLDGKAINSWENFKVSVAGNGQSLILDNKTTPKLSEIIVYDSIDGLNEVIFKTIVPSLILEFRGDRVKIDTFSNSSSQIAVRSNIDFDNLFNVDEPKTIEDGLGGSETANNTGFK
jgi:hypothetical protein